MRRIARAVYVCGGGARNPELMKAIQQALEDSGVAACRCMTTEALGVPPQQVEAAGVRVACDALRGARAGQIWRP